MEVLQNGRHAGRCDFGLFSHVARAVVLTIREVPITFLIGKSLDACRGHRLGSTIRSSISGSQLDPSKEEMMRKVLPAAVVALLLTAGAAAHRGPGAIMPQRANAVPFQPTGERKIPEAQAKSVALQRVQSDFAAGKLGAWGDPHVAGKACCDTERALFNPTGGKDGGGAYVVLVGREQAKGKVRVIVDATSGAVLSSVHRDFGGTPPDWWLQGLNSPPPAKR